jgi:hypothetical protein
MASDLPEIRIVNLGRVDGRDLSANLFRLFYSLRDYDEDDARRSREDQIRCSLLAPRLRKLARDGVDLLAVWHVLDRAVARDENRQAATEARARHRRWGALLDEMLPGWRARARGVQADRLRGRARGLLHAAIDDLPRRARRGRPAGAHSIMQTRHALKQLGVQTDAANDLLMFAGLKPLPLFLLSD